MMCNYISWQTKCFQLSGLEVVGIHLPKKQNPPSCQPDLPVGCDMYTLKQIELYQFPLFPSFSTFIRLLPLYTFYVSPSNQFLLFFHFTLFSLHPISSFGAFTHSTFLPSFPLHYTCPSLKACCRPALSKSPSSLMA